MNPLLVLSNGRSRSCSADRAVVISPVGQAQIGALGSTAAPVSVLLPSSPDDSQAETTPSRSSNPLCSLRLDDSKHAASSSHNRSTPSSRQLDDRCNAPPMCMQLQDLVGKHNNKRKRQATRRPAVSPPSVDPATTDNRDNSTVNAQWHAGSHGCVSVHASSSAVVAWDDSSQAYASLSSGRVPAAVLGPALSAFSLGTCRFDTSTNRETICFTLPVPPTGVQFEQQEAIAKFHSMSLARYSTSNTVSLTGTHRLRDIAHLIRSGFMRHQPPEPWNFDPYPFCVSSSICSQFAVEIPLSRDSAEFIGIELGILSQMPVTTAVTSIHRIQNPFLWHEFKHQFDALAAKGASTTMVPLFHGTRGLAPSAIVHSDIGFDFRHSSDQNFWGRAMYFCSNFSYADTYAHLPALSSLPPNSIDTRVASNTDPDVEYLHKQVILASVLIGDPYYGAPPTFTDSFRNLTRPPRKDSPRLPGSLDMTSLPLPTPSPLSHSASGDFDSVCGDVGCTRNYAVYAHHRAYPRYLITYAVPVTRRGRGVQPNAASSTAPVVVAAAASFNLSSIHTTSFAPTSL